MSAEHSHPNRNFLEIRALRIAADKVRLTPGLQIDIVASANDTLSATRHTYSFVGQAASPRTLNEALSDFVADLIPGDESRETLEKAFNENPSKVVRKGRREELSSEWPTVQNNVVIGLRAVKEDGTETVRTWYLKNTLKKKGLFHF